MLRIRGLVPSGEPVECTPPTTEGKRPCPDPPAVDLGPAEQLEEQRSRRCARETEHARRAAFLSLLFVPELERTEDAETACLRRRHGVHGELRQLLATADHEPREAVAGCPHDGTVEHRDRAQASGGVAVEPPVERLAAHRSTAPGLPEQRQVVATARGVERLELERAAHLISKPCRARR